MKGKKRNFNVRLIKKLEIYSFPEIARLCGVGENTISNWRKAGLQVISDKKPFLVKGVDLIAFHNHRNTSKKQKCAVGEIFCVKCKIPQMPLNQRVSIRQIHAKRLMLIGECPACNTRIHTLTTPEKLHQLREVLTILQLSESSLIDCLNPNVNCD